LIRLFFKRDLLYKFFYVRFILGGLSCFYNLDRQNCHCIEEISKGITVNSGSNTPVSFTVIRNEPGTYTVYVGGVSAGSFTVDGSAGPDIILYASIALILCALITGVFYLRKRQQEI